MFKKIIAIFFVIFSFKVQSQQTLLKLENSIKGSTNKIDGIVPIVNQKTNNFGFFIIEKKKIYGYEINFEFKVTDTIKPVILNEKFNIIIGGSAHKNNSYRVFLSKKNKREFVSIHLSPNNNLLTNSKFKLSSDERFLESFRYLNNFYLVAWHKIKNAFIVYTFNENGKPTANTVDLKKFRVSSSSDVKSKISKVLANNPGVKKIESSTPISIESASEKIKIYVADYKAVIAFDINKKFTELVTIDLNSFKAIYNLFDKPKLQKKIKKSNSFIYDNYLFTIAASSVDFGIDIINLKTKEKVKSFHTSKGDKINFKNTKIIQEGGYYEDYRELNNSKKFIKRLSSEKIGISVVKQNKNYHLLIGSHKNISRGNGIVFNMGINGGLDGFYNPNQFAFSSFSTTKATRIKALLDIEFNHIEGYMENNVFDKIKEYKFEGDLNAESIFLYKDFYISTDFNFIPNTFRFCKYSVKN